MTVEYRKLVDWNPRKGDVFEDRDGATLEAVSDTHVRFNDYSPKVITAPVDKFIFDYRLVSRASATHKTWGEMTDEEKGALLLAHHEGKVIEFYCYDGWVHIGHATWLDTYAYRVRPTEPKRETVTLYSRNPRNPRYSVDRWPSHTHCITFDLIDGKPDCASIRMEEL